MFFITCNHLPHPTYSHLSTSCVNIEILQYVFIQQPTITLISLTHSLRGAATEYSNNTCPRQTCSTKELFSYMYTPSFLFKKKHPILWIQFRHSKFTLPTIILYQNLKFLWPTTLYPQHTAQGIALPCKVRMQYVQISNIADTPIQCLISGQFTPMVKGCMDMNVWSGIYCL